MTIELLTEVSILREKVEKYEKAIEDINDEIEHIIDYTYDNTDYDTSLYNGAYKDGLYEALDIIDKHIGGE